MHFFRAGDVALVEDPTYFLAVRLLSDYGLRIVSVRSDADGLCVDALEAQLRCLPAATGPRRFRALLYLVPTYNNPTGSCMPLERRRRIVALAYAYDALVVCDDVYECLSFAGAPPTPPRIAALDEGADGRIVSNGSFSKIVCPGLRLGWLEAAPALLARISTSGLALSGGAPNHFLSAAMARMLERGACDRLLVQLRAAYAARRDAVLRALQQSAPPGVAYTQPAGGYFVWLTLPLARSGGAPVRADELLDLCRARARVLFQPGNLFSASRSCGHCIRLSYAHYPEAVLGPAVRAVCACIAAYLAT